MPHSSILQILFCFPLMRRPSEPGVPGPARATGVQDWLLTGGSFALSPAPSQRDRMVPQALVHTRPIEVLQHQTPLSASARGTALPHFCVPQMTDRKSPTSAYHARAPRTGPGRRAPPPNSANSPLGNPTASGIPPRPLASGPHLDPANFRL